MGKKKEYQSRGVEVVKVVGNYSGLESYYVLDTISRKEFLEGMKLNELKSVEFHNAVLVDGGTK